MNNCNDSVILLDDEDSVQVLELERANRKRKSEKNNNYKSTNIETIVIDEETSYHSNNENNNVIELPDSQDLVLDKPILNLDKIHQEDELFSDFIEKCLDLENSDGMIRIVNKTVIKAYEESAKEYRNSSVFRRVMLKAIQRLETNPQLKFSHVKDLVETLKLHKEKKRVQLTTLATNLKENGSHQKNGFPRKSRINSIILDSDDEQRDIPTINLDDYQVEVIEVLDEEKENIIEENRSLPNSQENCLVPHTEVQLECNPHSQGPICIQVVPIEYERARLDDSAEKIKAIESQIAWCKEQIVQLDEAEVEDDSMTSPYILCEKYKVQVVQLYKQLCQLTGDQPVKLRKVRLQVLEGHPPGPVRKLETFINDNIKEDGIPLFPDFLDVIKCVMLANIEDKLGWNKQLVINEANSLFTQCGRALQKRRKKREYRDLLSRVKVEHPEHDPAEKDPELQRKLEENRKIAIKKENDLLEMYVQLQYLPTQKPKPGPSLQVEQNEQPSLQVEQNEQPSFQVVQNEHSGFQVGQNEQSDFQVGQNEQSRFQVLQNEHSMLQVVPNEQTQLTNGDQNHENILQKTVTENPQPSNFDLISDEDSNFEPPEVELSQEVAKTDLESDKNKDSEVKVKQEPMDIVQMLEDLGDNYTISIIDIEDPYLVIEISSDDDSSDEEMHVDGESD